MSTFNISEKKLPQKAVSGLLWGSIEQFGTQFINLLFRILLARLLSPKDFGLIGMLTIFITISEAFVESGLGLALIQKKDVQENDFSAVFAFNVVVSSLLYVLLYLGFSPL